MKSEGEVLQAKGISGAKSERKSEWLQGKQQEESGVE